MMEGPEMNIDFFYGLLCVFFKNNYLGRGIASVGVILNREFPHGDYK